MGAARIIFTSILFIAAWIAVSCGPGLRLANNKSSSTTPGSQSVKATDPIQLIAGSAVNGHTHSGNLVPLTLTIPAPQVGHLMVLALGWCCTISSTPTLTDNAANTWTPFGPAVNDGSNNDSIQVFTAFVTNGSPTVITLGMNATNLDISATYAEFSGVSQDSPRDTSIQSALSNSTLGIAGPLVPSMAGELLFCVGDNDNDSNPGVPFNGFTQLPSNGAGVSMYTGLSVAYQILTSTAPVTCKFSYSVLTRLNITDLVHLNPT